MIKVEVKDEQVEAALARVAASLTDMTPLMQEIGEDLRVSTQDRMLAGQQPDGTAFAPRSPVTLQRYGKKGLTFGKPLNQSGDMRQNLATNAGADFVSIGSNAIQSAVMQFGARKGAFGSYQGKGFGGSAPKVSIPWGDIPARPFLGISDKDRSGILAAVSEYLGGAADPD